MYTSVQRAVRPRPVGVTIMVILDIIIAGVIPLIMAFAAMGDSTALPGGAGSALLLALLSVGVMGAAIGVWQGSNRARIALLVLIGVYYALNILGNSVVATADYVPAAAQTRAWSNVVRGVFWLGLNLVYFLRPQTRAWFKR